MIGSLTAIGDIVYVAEFDDTSTTGFVMKSGRPVFHYPRGTYTPVISDGRRLYLTGYSSITAPAPARGLQAPSIGAREPRFARNARRRERDGFVDA